MPKNKKQILRLQKFVGQLKENRYPNCKKFAEELRRLDIDFNRNIACSSKTIQRDIRLLREEFGCPLAYDYERNGYYLKSHGWNFNIPVLLEENELMAAILGARVAENIFPAPLRDDIRQAVDSQLANINPDFLDTAFIKSLVVIPGLKVHINPKVFMTIYQAWHEHNTIMITYLDVNDFQSERLVEPHALVYYECSWYIKGFCHLRHQVRNFAVHRIIDTKLTDRIFEPNQRIINSVLNDHFLEYSQVCNISIRCNNRIRNYVVSNPLSRSQKLMSDIDGCFLLYIPAMPEHEIIQWILFQAGDVELLEPSGLRSKIVEASKKICNKHM